MTKAWQVQKGRARFSEFIEACRGEAPQIVVEHGVETVVHFPIDEWNCLQRIIFPGLKDLFLASEKRTEALAPKRGAPRHRRTPALS